MFAMFLCRTSTRNALHRLQDFIKAQLIRPLAASLVATQGSSSPVLTLPIAGILMTSKPREVRFIPLMTCGLLKSLECQNIGGAKVYTRFHMKSVTGSSIYLPMAAIILTATPGVVPRTVRNTA
jgi:hypothetical protein